MGFGILGFRRYSPGFKAVGFGLPCRCLGLELREGRDLRK